MRVLAGNFALALIIALFVNEACAFQCDAIKQRYTPKKQKCKRELSLYWDSEPARATAALFSTVLRHALGYQNVYLDLEPKALGNLISMPLSENDNNFILALSLSWEPVLKTEWDGTEKYKTGLAGLRLEEMGASGLPTHQRLHVFIPESIRHLPQCADVTLFTFYIKASSKILTQCGFVANASSDGDTNKTIIIYELGQDRATTIQNDLKFLSSPHLHLQFQDRDRNALLLSNQSYLFLDYEIWAKYPEIKTVQLPLSRILMKTVSADFTYQQKPDATIGMRVADTFMILNHHPRIFYLARTFTPPLDSVREVLELTSSGKSFHEAACEWASSNIASVDTWVKTHNMNLYELPIFYCEDDPDAEEYDKLLEILNREIKNMTAPANTITECRAYRANCYDSIYLKDTIHAYVSAQTRDAILGVIVGGVAGITEALEAVDRVRIPMILHNAIGVDVESSNAAWLSTGHSLHIALVLHRFVSSMNWTRIAILSENTLTAKSLVNNLHDLGGFAFHDHDIPKQLSLLRAENILKELKAAEARVIYVNTNSKDALTILSAAVTVGMSDSEKYVWILRDWEPNNKTVDVKHFTISFWCRSANDVPNADSKTGIHKEMEKLWPNRLWPAQATVLTDAVYMLVQSFNSIIVKHPKFLDDTHNVEVNKLREESIVKEPIQGIVQKLIYKGRSLEEAVVFVDEWRGDQRELLSRWRVNVTSRSVFVEELRREAYSTVPPKDGTAPCFVYYGDPYLPTCYDGLIVALIILFLGIPITAFIHRTFNNRRKQLECNMNKNKLSPPPQNRENIKSRLSAYMVKPTSLEVRQKIGTGRFGSVHLAMYNARNCSPQVVAIKELGDKQDEMFNEACILASLDHDRIIRLVAVCIDHEPPLMITEMAFFGNLLKYLRDRRHIAESIASGVDIGFDVNCLEAAHVTAEALTNLACQAASALAYLSLRGVIHCQICASSCLVDVNRSLKLSNFSMARTTSSSEDVCKKSPQVRWIAPESQDGTFSFASDVWSFGVLIMELVTLGFHPYGDISSPNDAQLISSSGSLRLPLDASPQTKELVQMCWCLEPDKRASADQLVSYLTERPSALQPALDLELL